MKCSGIFLIQKHMFVMTGSYLILFKQNEND
jgi:hypothetical protein